MATYRIVDMYRKSKAVKGIHYDSWDEPILAYRVIHYSLDLFIIGNMVQIIFSQCARFIRLMKLRKLS